MNTNPIHLAAAFRFVTVALELIRDNRNDTAEHVRHQGAADTAALIYELVDLGLKVQAALNATAR